MGDVIDSTLMPINEGNAHGTQRERTNDVKFDPNRLLESLAASFTSLFVVCE